MRQLLTKGAIRGTGQACLDHQEILRSVRLGIEAGRLPEDTGTTIPDILDRFRLRQDERLLNAAVVLFSRSPLPDYPQCGIRLARFATATKDEFIDNRQEQGHAFALLEEAMTFFRRHLSIAGRFHPDRIERKDTPEYPVLALRTPLIANVFYRRGLIEGVGHRRSWSCASRVGTQSPMSTNPPPASTSPPCSMSTTSRCCSSSPPRPCTPSHGAGRYRP